MLLSSLPRPVPSPRKAGEHLLGLSSGLLPRSLSIIMVVKPGAQEQQPRQIGLKPRLGKRRQRKRDQVQRGMGGKVQSKLIYLPFGGHSITYPCSPVTILGEKGLAKFQCPRGKKMIIIMENPFHLIFLIFHLPLKNMYKIYWERKSLLIFFPSQWWISPWWASLNVRKKRDLLRKI